MIAARDPSRQSRVAVVNDDSTQLSLLKRLLARDGMEVLGYLSAEEALARLTARGAPPDLIITDLYMPGIDGWRFCRLLRSPEYAPFNHTPILVVSATFAGDEPSRIAADVGADAFLSYPVDVKRFAEQVRALLAGERAREPLRVLIVEENGAQAAALEKAFAIHGYRADVAVTARAATASFAAAAYDVVVLNDHLRDGAGDVLLSDFCARRPDCVYLMMTTDPSPELALAWMRQGAAAYLRKPFDPDYLMELCAKARRERALLRLEDLLEMRTRELHASEERYRQLAEGMPAYVSTFLPDGTLTYVNEMLAAWDGMSPSDLIGRNFIELLSAEDREMVTTRLSTLTSQHPTETHEQRYLRPDGEYHHQWTNRAFFDDQGRVTYLQAIGHDITERKRTEKAQRLQYDLVRALNSAVDLRQALACILDAVLQLERMDCGAIYVADMDSGALDLAVQRGLSPQFVELVSHYSPDSPHVHMALAGEARYGLYTDIRPTTDEIRQREGLRAFAFVPVLHQGELIAVMNLASHTHDAIPDSTRAAIEALMLPIGSILMRLRSDAALRASEERYRLLVENQQDLVVKTDIEGRFLYVNPAYCQLFDKSEAELLGVVYSPLVHPDDLPAVEKAVMSLFQPPFECSFEERAMTRRGWRWLSWTAGAALDEDGMISTLIGSGRDITERKEAEEALRESEHRLATLISNLPGFVYRCVNDRAWTMEFISDGCREITGYTPEEFLHNRKLAFNDIVHPDYQEMLWQKWQELLPQRKPFEEEYPILSASGDVRWVWERGRGIFSAAGELLFLEGFITDITERKRAEDALRASEERHRAILQTAMDGFWLTDGQGHLQEVNEAYCQMSGYGEQELLAMSISDLEAVETPADTAAHMRKTMAQGEDRFESRHRRQDGSTFDVEISTQYKITGGGQFVAFLRDITERKRAEEALRAREEMLRTIFENSPIALEVYDRQATLRQCNRIGYEMFGTTPEAIIGKFNLRDDPNYQDRQVWERLDRGEEVRHEIAFSFDRAEYMTTKKGIVHYFIITTPIPPDISREIGYIMQILDITERKRAEEALRTLNQSLATMNTQLQEAVQAKDEMIQNVSHELRTPLALILGHTELLRDGFLGPLPADQRRSVVTIDTQGQRLLFLVNRLLLLQTLSTRTLRKSPLQLEPWLGGIVTAWEQRSAHAQIAIALAVEAGLPPLAADSDLLEQVVTNLLENAFKFSPQGSRVTIRASRHGAEIHIAVSDQGIGIPSDKLTRLFERFYQVDSGSTRRFGGVGIGLALCKEIVETHGGRIWAESEGEGKGSTFHVVLPA